MSRLALCVAVLAVLLAACPGADAHECPMGRHPAFRARMEAAQPLGDVQYSGQRAAAPANMRVVLSTLDLEDSAKYCTAAGQVVWDMYSRNVVCTEADVFTATIKAALVNNILPAAVKLISSALLLSTPVASPIRVPSTACPGDRITITEAQKIPGVAAADVVLYVSAAPSYPGVAAWAYTCNTDAAGRPVIGHANFVPRYLSWSGVAGSADDDDMVTTAAHEILHALGYNGYVFGQKGLAQSYQRRGKVVQLFVGPAATAAARDFYKCPQLAGVELEDEGGSGSAASHVDRRIAMQDIMNPVAGRTLLSPITLGIMQDLGWYAVNASAVTGNMTYGHSAGCGFSFSACNTTSGGRNEYFCFATDGDGCSFDYTGARAACAVLQYSSNIPAHFRYFTSPSVGGREFVDYCPIRESPSSDFCLSPRTPTTTQSNVGNAFGAHSRCFPISYNFVRVSSGLTATLFRTACFESRCVLLSAAGGAVTNVVQFRLDGGSTWYNCTSSTSSVSNIAGFTGDVTCPDVDRFCRYYALTSGADGWGVYAAPAGAAPTVLPAGSVTTETKVENSFAAAPPREGHALVAAAAWAVLVLAF